LKADSSRGNSEGLAYLVTDSGRPFSIKGFGNKFRQWCDEASLPHCSAHGIRKADACLAAEEGATSHQLQSMFGWKSIQEAERYTQAARRKKMAGDGMPLLRRGEARTKVSRRKGRQFSHLAKLIDVA
jgi:site-specific recombinase XerD